MQKALETEFAFTCTVYLNRRFAQNGEIKGNV